MTTTERRLRHVEQSLADESCNCGAASRLEYEPGVTVIRCGREGCKTIVVLPDFQPEAALSEWREKTK